MHAKIREYLIHCYLYYKLDNCIISDPEFDALCKEILSGGIEDPLVSQEDLQAGTGYSIAEYPADIIEEAEARLKAHAPESKPAAGDDRQPFKFNGHPMETYLLLGMYIDFGYAKQRDKQEEIRQELQRRWTAGMHRSEFKKYFEDHGVKPERFGLNAEEKESNA